MWPTRPSKLSFDAQVGATYARSQLTPSLIGGGDPEQLSNSLFRSSGGGPCRLRVGGNAGTPHFEKRLIYDLSQETKNGVDELLALVTAANVPVYQARGVDVDLLILAWRMIG